MDTRIVDNQNGRRTIVAVFEAGDDVTAGLGQCAAWYGLNGGQLSAVGALQEATLGFWDPEKQDYVKIPVSEQVEVVSLVGNVSLAADGSPKVHAHVVVAGRDGVARGGHLLGGTVRPTLEATFIESPSTLQRQRNESTGLEQIGL